jgi:hypothetical protein
VSVGRGTSEPFELMGAPWIDGKVLASYLQDRGIPGVRFTAADFTPVSDRYAGEPCHGVRLSLTDRTLLNASHLGIELVAALHRLYHEDFHIERMLGLIDRRTRSRRSTTASILAPSRFNGTRGSKPSRRCVPNICSTNRARVSTGRVVVRLVPLAAINAASSTNRILLVAMKDGSPERQCRCVAPRPTRSCTSRVGPLGCRRP